MRRRSLACLLVAGLLAGAPEPASGAPAPEALVKAFTGGVRQVNEAHARKPGKIREADLAARLPRQARKALEDLLKAPDGPAVREGLLACGEAALDLDLAQDFARIRERLEKTSPEHAARLGLALSRPRFVLRGLGGVEPALLERFAGVLEAVLAGYDEVFGFEEWSKVPGKKLRVRIHRDENPDRKPRFAPQFPFHSEIDFPVQDGAALRSPTADGKFLFFGLCHELGHVIAMWGDLRREEDHHAWADYTGYAVVEHLAEKRKDDPALAGLGDVRWRSLAVERKRLKGKPPSLSDRDGVLALLLALHDQVGPKALGAAVNALDRKDRRLRLNRVRYYTFKDLREGLLETLKDGQARKAAASLIP